MADNNNNLAGKINKTPNPALKKLERLIGTWQQSGEYNGTSTFELMEGGFFIIQHFDGIIYGRHIKGIEYIGFDDDTKTLRSHLMGIDGSNFTYTWDMDGNTWTIWFGEKGSDNFYTGIISKDGDTVTGGWQWPGGGYKATLTRIKE
jgi:hypothetical protein